MIETVEQRSAAVERLTAAVAAYCSPDAELRFQLECVRHRYINLDDVFECVVAHPRFSSPAAESAFREEVRACAELLADDGELVAVEGCYQYLKEEPAALIRRMKTTMMEAGGKIPSSILIDAARTYGDTDDIDRTYQVKPLKDVNGIMYDDVGKVADLRGEITGLYLDYCGRNSLRMREFNPTVADLNAVAELSEQEPYDLTIGVVRGGVNVPNLLHAHGWPLAYLEHHTHWQRSPIWRTIAGKHVEIRKGMRLLLCEDDASSGGTLQKVTAKLKAAGASQVDLCFTGASFEHSKECAETAGGFERIFHSVQLPQTKVYTNMLRVREQLQTSLS
jgi:hypothetical protein